VPDVGLNLARIADSMAELCRKHPERFPAFAAALCMTDVEGSVAEARRAVKDLGARGVLLYTNVAGEPLDQKKFEPIFATMAELDLPIWLHPARTAAMPDYAAESKSRFEMWWCFLAYGLPHAMVRWFFGLLDRYPNQDHHPPPRMIFMAMVASVCLKVLGKRTSDLYSKICPRSGRTWITCTTSTATPPCSAAACMPRAAAWNFSAPITWCLRPTPRSARSRRPSRP
jgi:aminocarboxymuconate-semialdehyde decarboxylase